VEGIGAEHATARNRTAALGSAVREVCDEVRMSDTVDRVKWRRLELH
jgi:hypothetical protein